MNKTPMIKDIESLQTYLETKFMTKVLFILKNSNLNPDQQYNIAKIFKENYTKKIVELTDDPKLDKNKIMEKINETFCLENNDTKTIVTYRMVDLICKEFYNIWKTEIQQGNDTFTYNRFEFYDDEINLYNEYY